MRGFEQLGRSRRDGITVRGNRGCVNRARPRRRDAGGGFEVLEDRTLLSTLDITSRALTYDATGAASDLTVSLVNSTTLSFSDTDQTIFLSTNAGQAGWSGSGTNTVTGPLASVGSMSISGTTTAGQSLTLGYASGDPLPASGVTYDPGVPTNGSNELTLEGGSFTSETYAATGAGAGTITYSDSSQSNVPIAFSNLSPITDTVPSPTFGFDAPSIATTVQFNTGPIVGGAQTDQINDGGTGTFELVNFAKKTAVTLNVSNVGATTTLNYPSPAEGLTTLDVDSGAGSETVDVQTSAAGVTTTVDTGAVSGSQINVGLGGSLAAINGPVFARSTGGSNTLALDDSSEGTGNRYTIAGSRVTASTFASFVDFSGVGITTLDLTSPGAGDTFDFTGPVQSDVTTYNFSADSGPGPNTLNVTSSVSDVGYSTPGVLTFGTGEPVVNYTNFQTINITKPASPPVGTARTISVTQGQAFTQAIVATFTESDLGQAIGDYVASINWGDGTPTSGGTIVANGTTSYDVTGGHTYAEPGTYTVGVTVTTLGSTGSTTVSGTTINVTSNGPVNSVPDPIPSTADVAAAQPPVNSVENLTGLAISAVQDKEFTTDVATFTDTSSVAVASDFLASINWGDGTTTAGTITEDASDTFYVSGTHTYTTAGSFTPVVTIKDQYGALYTTGDLNQTNLVSSVSGMAGVTDPSLIDPWGLASSSTSPIWVSDAGSGVSTLYTIDTTSVTKVGLTVTIPSATGVGAGSPTGIVFNTDPSTTDFPVPPGTTAAKFLFDTLDGTIAAWDSGSTAATAARLTGAQFTGLAQASVTTTYYLYATNFNPTSGTAGIVVFSPTYANVTSTTFAGKFVDPNAIAGYEPFNIALLNGDLYVTYAKPTGSAGTFTASDGYIDEFDTSGNFIGRIYTDTAGTDLDGPWAMVIAPSGFGSYGGDLLVGNFGDGGTTSPDGTISAFKLSTTAGGTATFEGMLSGPNGTIVNAGQWGLLFGNGGSGGKTTTLYLSAGIDAQRQGLFAQIAPAAATSASVAAAPLDAQGTTIRGIEGNSLAVSNGTADVLVGTFMDTGTPGAASSYSATINWGDGSTPTADTRITSQGTPNGTVFSVFGNHTYAEVGTYQVTVTITNSANGAVAVASSSAVIADAALTPSTTQPTVSTTEDIVYSGAIGSFTDANPTAPLTDYDYVMIYWGDGTPATAGTVSQPARRGYPV